MEQNFADLFSSAFSDTNLPSYEDEDLDFNAQSLEVEDRSSIIGFSSLPVLREGDEDDLNLCQERSSDESRNCVIPEEQVLHQSKSPVTDFTDDTGDFGTERLSSLVELSEINIVSGDEVEEEILECDEEKADFDEQKYFGNLQPFVSIHSEKEEVDKVGDTDIPNLDYDDEERIDSMVPLQLEAGVANGPDENAQLNINIRSEDEIQDNNWEDNGFQCNLSKCVFRNDIETDEKMIDSSEQYKSDIPVDCSEMERMELKQFHEHERDSVIANDCSHQSEDENERKDEEVTVPLEEQDNTEEEQEKTSYKEADITNAEKDEFENMFFESIKVVGELKEFIEDDQEVIGEGYAEYPTELFEEENQGKGNREIQKEASATVDILEMEEICGNIWENHSQFQFQKTVCGNVVKDNENSEGEESDSAMRRLNDAFAREKSFDGCMELEQRRTKTQPVVMDVLNENDELVQNIDKTEEEMDIMCIKDAGGSDEDPEEQYSSESQQTIDHGHWSSGLPTILTLDKSNTHDDLEISVTKQFKTSDIPNKCSNQGTDGKHLNIQEESTEGCFAAAELWSLGGLIGECRTIEDLSALDNQNKCMPPEVVQDQETCAGKEREEDENVMLSEMLLLEEKLDETFPDSEVIFPKEQDNTDADDEEDFAEWEKEQGRIDAFNRFYNDCDEDNSVGQEGRKQTVRFCLDQSTESKSDVDEVSSDSSEESQDHVAMLTRPSVDLEEDSDSEVSRQDFLLLLQQSRATQKELLKFNATMKTHQKVNKLPRILKAVMKLSLITVCGVLVFWWTTGQLDWMV